MEAYYYWDGRPAPSRKEADWVVMIWSGRDAMAAYANWDNGIDVYIERGLAFSTWARSRRDALLFIKRVLGWPTVFDVNTLAELLLAEERDAVFQFLRQRPFKPSSRYKKSEELKIEAMAHRRELAGLTYREATLGPLVLGAEDLAPLYAKVPAGREYGCAVYDAWGRPAELRPLAESETADPVGWIALPWVKLWEGELPGAGWAACWARIDDVVRIDFYAYVNFREYGSAILVEGSVKTVRSNREVAAWAKPVWTPDFNAALADIFIEAREEPA